MKAVLLAGGSGTRLRPMTQCINKHLLPIYNKPMVYYPLSSLILLGIRDILVTTHAKEMPLFQELLGDGSQFGIKISYEIQEKAGGIAEVLKISQNFLKDTDRFVMILGDNIFYIPNIKDELKPLASLKDGAGIVISHVDSPERFGVAHVDEHNNVLSIEEKPLKPRSNFAVTGLYFYDSMALDFADNLQASARGELEITDINNKYIERKALSSISLTKSAMWLDTGTPESMLDASEFVRITEKKHRMLVGSPEEAAFSSGFIDAAQLEKLASKMNKSSEYRNYLLELL